MSIELRSAKTKEHKSEPAEVPLHSRSVDEESTNAAAWSEMASAASLAWKTTSFLRLLW